MGTYENIKRRRKELGYTQEDLANKLGYSDRSIIAKIEHGKVDLQLGRLEDIAKALEIEPYELLGLDVPDQADIDELVALYRASTNEQRKMILAVARSLSSSQNTL